MLLDARRKKRRALSDLRFGRHAQGRLGTCAELIHSRKPFGALAREAREILGVDPPRGVVAFGRARRGPTAALPGNLRGNKLRRDILSTTGAPVRGFGAAAARRSSTRAGVTTLFTPRSKPARFSNEVLPSEKVLNMCMCMHMYMYGYGTAEVPIAIRL